MLQTIHIHSTAASDGNQEKILIQLKSNYIELSVKVVVGQGYCLIKPLTNDDGHIHE